MPVGPTARMAVLHPGPRELALQCRMMIDGVLAVIRCNASNLLTPAEGRPHAAALSCFLRMSGRFFPSTTARLIVTSAMSSRLGTSYIMSSMMRSSMDRNARAPVPFVTAWAASAFNASLVTANRTFSIEKSLVYCFTIAFLVLVKIYNLSESISASSSIAVGIRIDDILQLQILSKRNVYY